MSSLATQKIYREVNREREVLRHREYRLANLEKVRAAARRRYQKNKERYRKIREANRELLRERSRKYNAANRHKIYEYSLKQLYNLTIDQYNAMVEAQGGVCKICGKPGKLVVDHNHTTKIVRGLLCNNCNHVLGHAHDNPEILQRAIEYLKAGV